MNDFVTDDEQVERIKNWWSDNGSSVIAGLVIGIGGLMGWRYWVDYQTNVAAEASSHFANMVSSVESNKNDAVDAEAIAEASRRPTMRFVGVKSVYQQDIKAVHNVRASLVKRKTALSNEIRAMLFEYGQIIPKGIAYTQKQVPRILEDADNELSTTLRDMVQELYSEFLEVIKKIEK